MQVFLGIENNFKRQACCNFVINLNTYRYGFVALSVWMCVAGANNVEGTMSFCLGTNEILTSKHDIAALNVKQGHFIETAVLVIHNWVIFYYF